jgi:hypothetical protein
LHEVHAVCAGPGQLLHADMKAQEGRPLEGMVLADIHDQYKFNFKPEHIERDDSKVRLDRAFTPDFHVNGPRHATGEGFFQTDVCD